MITPLLEEMIWCGKAAYKTWTIGTPAAGLKVGANKTVIILGFDYFPFIDSETNDVNVGSRSAHWLKMNKQVTIYDKKKRHNFLVRNYFESNQGVRPDFIHIDCYLPFTQDVNLNIATILPVFQWGITSIAAPVNSESKRKPLGYGNVDTPNLVPPAYIDFNDVSDSQVRPFTDQRSNKSVSYDQFQVPFETDTEVDDPDANINFVGNMQFPMITVHYMEINERVEAKFI